MSIEQTFEEMITKGVLDALADVDEEKLQEALNSNVLADAMAEAVPQVAEALAEDLYRVAPEMLADRAGSQAATRDHVRRVFGPGLDVCEMVLRIAIEMGEEFTTDKFGDGQAVPVLPFTLAHLLARTCRIGEETLLLLKNGWGPGAYSRWRAMHEVAVFASFIASHGDEAAHRFVEHHPVQRWRTLCSERDRFETAQQSVPQHVVDEIAELDARVAELRERFGRVFLTSYGWAADALDIPPDRQRGPTLRLIEETAGFGHLRRYYQKASESVHPISAAVLLPDDAPLLGSTLLTAPSLSGIVTPAHAMCLTLTNATAAVLMSRDSWSAPFVIKTMTNMAERAGEELAAAWSDYEAGFTEDVEAEEVGP